MVYLATLLTTFVYIIREFSVKKNARNPRTKKTKSPAVLESGIYFVCFRELKLWVSGPNYVILYYAASLRAMCLFFS